MAKSKSRKTYIYWCYIITYFLFLFRAGFCFFEKWGMLTTVFLLFISSCLVFYYRRKIDVHIFGGCLAIIFFSIITGIFRGFPIYNEYLLFLANLLVAILVASFMDKKAFFTTFSNLTLAICIATLFLMLLSFIGIPLYRVFPLVTNSYDLPGYFALLTTYVDYTVQGVTRATGIFWEAGAFQFFIIVSLVIDLYDKEQKKFEKMRLLVFVVSIFLTYSTTGYICLVLYFILRSINNRKYKLIPLFIVSFVVILSLSYLSKASDGFLYYSTFGKYYMMADNSSDNSSISSRQESMILPLEKLVDHPIVGLGEDGWNELRKKTGHRMFTCTPINYFAKYGIVCGLFCLFCFLRCMNLNNKQRGEPLLIAILLLTSTISEDFTFNPILTIFMFYGLQSYFKIKSFNNSRLLYNSNVQN